MTTRSSITRAQIEQCLHQTSDSLLANGSMSPRTWTSAIKTAFTDLAYSKSLCICCNGTESDPTTTEWLWDIAIYESNCPRGSTVGKMQLILESEYNSHPARILEDIQKLFVGRALIRCYIFFSGDLDHRNQLFKYIGDLISSNPNVEDSDEYLIAGWSSDHQGFEYRLLKKECEQDASGNRR